MDRSGVFVDAGYVYAAGGKLCYGIMSRSGIVLDVRGFVGMIENLIAEDSQLPVLRTYWYDGARDHIPTTSHLDIAALPHVKLRLGQLNRRNQQKGVDALIYRDLMTLANERAIADAYLLSGDEDLREGVRAAQDMGVRVTLLGIQPMKGEHNQSRDLVHEADSVIILRKSQLRPLFSTASAASVSVPLWEDGENVVPPLIETPELIAVRYAKDWWARASTSDRSALLASSPKVPTTLDADLLSAARKAGVVVDDESLRRRIRKAFRDEIRHQSMVSLNTAGEAESEPTGQPRSSTAAT